MNEQNAQLIRKYVKSNLSNSELSKAWNDFRSYQNCNWLIGPLSCSKFEDWLKTREQPADDPVESKDKKLIIRPRSTIKAKHEKK